MKNILEKLHLVQCEIKRMNKDGFNSFNKYNYLSETQITETIKELFDKHRIVFHFQSEVTETKEYQGGKGDTQFLVTAKIHYAFYDVESGEKLDGIVYGQGADKGDKGLYKAITGAIKYLYMKTFNIPTGDDPENDKHEPEARKPYAAPKRKTDVYGEDSDLTSNSKNINVEDLPF